MKRPIVMLFVIAAVVVAIIKLSPEQPDKPSQTAETAPANAGDVVRAKSKSTSIAWFDGSVEQAFEIAAAENKPILLYWGAEWCPPCAQLKATIFKRPDFIAKTDMFVAVYIDGDEPGAQQYQDRFSARGYPTLIVFNPAGEEITRIPGGINLERYVDVLDLALNRVTPVAQLVTNIMDSGYQPNAEESRLLAYYSWGQDRGKALAEREQQDVFARLVALTPPERVEEYSRFVGAYLYSLTKLEEDISAEVASSARATLMDLLADDAASAAASSFVAFGVAKVIDKLSEEGSETRTALETAWGQRLAEDWATDDSTGVQRLRTLLGQLELAKLRSDEVPEELQQRIREAVAEERQRAGDRYSRIAVVNAAFYLLRDSGQGEVADEMLQQELADDVNAFYWMLDLADLAEKSDRKDEAVTWLRKAYDGSVGPATRVQWGSIYVAGLIRLTADRSDEIDGAVNQVFDELAAQQQPISGRNKGAIKRIARSLHEWVEEEDESRSAILSAALDRFSGMCDASFSEAEQQGECLALFDKPEEEPVG